MAKTIGIDLGTSNSAVAAVVGKDSEGRPQISMIKSEDEQYSYFPSVVSFRKDGVVVGSRAKREAYLYPDSTVMHIKREMGTNYKKNIRGKDYTPEEIASEILKKAKRDAEEFFGEKITNAVITIPARFGVLERNATKEAAKLAGLKVEDRFLIDEPIAACITYYAKGYFKGAEGPQNIMVFDLGAGTLDIAIVRIEKIEELSVFGFANDEKREEKMRVVCTAGDTKLGGMDMDMAILNMMVEEFEKDTGINLRDNEVAMSKLMIAVENAKIDLSTRDVTNISIPNICEGRFFNRELSRRELENLIRPIVEKCRKPIRIALKKANLDRREISKLIAVGGPTNMPIVQRLLREEVCEPMIGIDPMCCVAMGAAICGAGLETVEGRLPRAYGFLFDNNFIEILKEGDIYGTKKSGIYILSPSLDPQEIVSGIREVHIEIIEKDSDRNKNISLGKYAFSIPISIKAEEIIITFCVDQNGIIDINMRHVDSNVEATVVNATGGREEETEKLSNLTTISPEDYERKVKVQSEKEEIAMFGLMINILLHEANALLKLWNIDTYDRERITEAKNELEDIFNNVKQKGRITNRDRAELAYRIQCLKGSIEQCKKNMGMKLMEDNEQNEKEEMIDKVAKIIEVETIEANNLINEAERLLKRLDENGKSKIRIVIDNLKKAVNKRYASVDEGIKVIANIRTNKDALKQSLRHYGITILDN